MINSTAISLIKVDNLGINLNDKLILKNINFEIFTKQIITIIGPNGAGKSTLLKAILGFIKPSFGQIISNPNLKIGYMPQKIFFPEQIPITVIKFLTLNNKFCIKSRIQLNPELNIEHLLYKSIHTLSGGELQRVLLAKALLNQPNLLILDEPTKSIDVNGQAEFYKLCSNIQEKLNCAILMASHDLHIVMSNINSVICLNKHICCHGLPETVSQHKEFIKLFGANVNKLAFYTHHHDHQHSLDGKIKSLKKELEYE
jgi:zinc transport system ATP-binding protein